MSSASHECSLHGIIDNKGLQPLLQRLIGLCGQSMQTDLFDHEVIFTPAVRTPIGPARNDDVLLRLRSKVLPGTEFNLEKRQWQLCLQGPPETQTQQRSVTARPITNVNIHGEAFRFMDTLGYTFAYEIVKKGYSFVFNDVIRVNVCQIFKLETKHDLSTMKLPFEEKTKDNKDIKGDDNSHWLIEISSIFIAREQVNQMNSMVEQLKGFKALLNGIVDLEQVDHRAVQNKIQYTT